ncbi:MAG: phosphate--acyl-ACP acyltransferase, partial [Bacteroidia bacterium]
MRIGLDVMGGDHAPKAIVGGAVLAMKEFPKGVALVLIGDKKKILDELKNHHAPADKYEIV